MDFLQWAFLLNALEIHLIPPRKGCRAVTVQGLWQFSCGAGRGAATGGRMCSSAGGS